MPRVCTLDGFSEATAGGGVNLSDLDPITTLVVRTRNSIYRLTMLQPPSTVCLQGGRFFPDPTEVTVDGSSLGGSCLKLAWIAPGFRMEVHGPCGWIVTSPVCAIDVASVSTTSH